MNEKKNNKLLHIARIIKEDGRKTYLLLREVAPEHYVWFEEDSLGTEIETTVKAATIKDAIQFAYAFWKLNNFSTVICGFRYSLPERDEHGVNALFYQMAASYSSTTGIYFDETVSHNCVVHNASIEARQLFKRLQQESRL